MNAKKNEDYQSPPSSAGGKYRYANTSQKKQLVHLEKLQKLKEFEQNYGNIKMKPGSSNIMQMINNNMQRNKKLI